MTPRKICFYAAELITALGDDIAQNLSAIENGNARPTIIDVPLQESNLSIPYFTIKDPDLQCSGNRLHKIIDKVIGRTLAKSGLSNADIAEMGLFIGSTSSDCYLVEEKVKKSDRTDANISRSIAPFSDLATYIRDVYNINGPVYTFNTACTSSANALIYAAEFIRNGDIKHALVVGLEFYNETSAMGFWGLELISKNGMRPFNRNRDGLHLGEGCSAIIISAEPAAHNFGYIAGANIGDNFSVTACNPDGSTIEKVVQQALLQANINPSQIQLVKTHGTASLSNDEAEAAGLQKIFASIPPIVALKPLIGHTLGACGINELVLFYHLIAAGKSLNILDTLIADDAFRLRFADDTDRIVPGYFLLNYFGFGGNNAVLVIGNE